MDGLIKSGGLKRVSKCARLTNRMYLHECENMVRRFHEAVSRQSNLQSFLTVLHFFPSKYLISELYDPSKAFLNSHMLSSKSLGATLLLCHILFSLFMARSHILLSILTSPSVPVYEGRNLHDQTELCMFDRQWELLAPAVYLNENERKCLSLGKGSSATYTLSLDTGCFYAQFQSDPCTLTL